MGNTDSNSLAHIYDNKSHANLLKTFTISSLLAIITVVLLVSLGIGRIYKYFTLRLAETDAIHIGQALFERERQAMLYSDPEGKLHFFIGDDNPIDFDQRIRKYLQPLRIVKIKIFSNDKKIVYSTDDTIIGKIDISNEDLNRSLHGEVVSKVRSKERVWDLSSEQKFDLDLVETYLPLKDKDNAIIGSFELYIDVSRYRGKHREVLSSSVAVVSTVLFLVFGILFFIMRHATRVIHSKTQEIKMLSGLLPICSYCKNIRNNAGEWEPLEKYITERSESVFSHGICDECKEKHFPGL
jgi:hypothetical protein